MQPQDSLAEPHQQLGHLELVRLAHMQGTPHTHSFRTSLRTRPVRARVWFQDYLTFVLPFIYSWAALLHAWICWNVYNNCLQQKFYRSILSRTTKLVISGNNCKNGSFCLQSTISHLDVQLYKIKRIYILKGVKQNCSTTLTGSFRICIELNWYTKHKMCWQCYTLAQMTRLEI